MIVGLAHCTGGKWALSPVHAGRRKVGPLASLTTGTSGTPSGCPWGPCRRRSPSRRPRAASLPGPFGTTGTGGQKDATPSSSIGHRARCLRKVTGATPGGEAALQKGPGPHAGHAGHHAGNPGHRHPGHRRQAAAGGSSRWRILAPRAFWLGKIASIRHG